MRDVRRGLAAVRRARMDDPWREFSMIGSRWTGLADAFDWPCGGKHAVTRDAVRGDGNRPGTDAKIVAGHGTKAACPGTAAR
jgi:hypothetical protein